MSRLAAIQKNKPLKPVRVLIYGVEGVGKTTFGSKAPNPVFISPEGGTDELSQGVQMPNIATWNDVRDAVRELITAEHPYKTLVIDSADWVEKLAHVQIVGKAGKSITQANGGYGAGYRESEIMHKGLIDDLSILREGRGMNIIVTAHYQVKTVKDPEATQDYDAFEIKCHEMVSSLWREWVDCLLFARFKTYTKIGDDKEKAIALTDGARVVYTQKKPAFQAKNRYGLPPEMPFTENFWNDFISARMRGRETPDFTLLAEELNGMWMQIQDKELAEKVKQSVLSAGQDIGQLIAIRERLKQIQGAA